MIQHADVPNATLDLGDLIDCQKHAGAPLRTIGCVAKLAITAIAPGVQHAGESDRRRVRTPGRHCGNIDRVFSVLGVGVVYGVGGFRLGAHPVLNDGWVPLVIIGAVTQAP